MAEPQTLDSCKKLYQDDILFWKFCQYEFYRQWHALKQYANKKGIEIIGDIPIYVSLDSADVWLHPSLFKLPVYRRTSSAGLGSYGETQFMHGMQWPGTAFSGGKSA